MSKGKIVLIHGFNVKDGGRNTVDKLAPHLREAGYTVETDEADYGFFSLWMVRFAKHSAVLRIANALKSADIVISHSNGSNYENMALRLLDQHKKEYVSFRLSPALNRKTPYPVSVKRGFVFHTMSDFWVWVSGFLPFHPWGRMGQRGYSGQDSRIINRDFTDLIRGHSDWFKNGNAKFVASEILTALEES